MKTTTREPHAPLAALPELDDFLRPFHVHFRRSEGRQSLERYLTGLLTEHPNKNCDTIAQVVPGTSEERLQGPRTASWTGASGSRGKSEPARDDCGGLFPSQPDRRRESLPEVHRQVCDWLRLETAKELLSREIMTLPEQVPA